MYAASEATYERTITV